jgi:DNA-binding response OmpR family regulator
MSEEPRRKKILIVDDTKDILIVVSRRVQSWGYDAFTAESGEEGIKIAEEQLPDLILLDIMMPRMKGRDVCARLKANPQTAKIPVIFLTALGLADHIKAGLDLGADDYIVKPFEPAELKERIAVCLARQQTGSSSPPPQGGS